MSSRKKITILGVTGSVGRAAMDVILSQPDRFDVQVVTAGKNAKELAQAAISLKARKAVIADEDKLPELQKLLQWTDIESEAGNEAIESCAGEPADLVLAAIVGFSGLRPILRALEYGINVAIANKEPLVAAGALVMETALKNSAKIIPVDSEHNAIFQVFENQNRAQIDKIILTASGGPFRSWAYEDMQKATPEQAIKHPNWTMGPKISIDSATMMNKALEVIEAYHLFSLPTQKIEVIVHPQSIVHSMVSYADGSILAQMGPSDMRIPVAYALGWPERLELKEPKLDLNTLANLTFEAPDFKKFPALKYAYECLEKGQKACIALNAANEVAVEAFLAGKIAFGDIMHCVEKTLLKSAVTNDKNSTKTVEEIEEYDNMMRLVAKDYIKEKAK